jgi:hypothetical protein
MRITTAQPLTYPRMHMVLGSENLPKHEWKSRVLFLDSPHFLLKDYWLLPKVEVVEWVATLPPPNPHIPL